MLEKIAAIIIATIATVVIWAAVMWGLWSLWRWVVPQVWTAGPQNVVSPSFWLFAACWTLMAMVGRALFGGRSK